MAATIRAETPTDRDAVRDVVTRTFARPGEASLVDALRAAGKATLSLVADRDGRVVGHVLFSPVTRGGAAARLASGLAPLASGLAPLASGLAPLAVAPAAQRQGLGAALVRAGLARCRAAGHAYVVVLGSPQYYGRFGFVPAERHQITCEYDVPPGVFQIVELLPGALAGRAGLVRYAAEFAAV